MSARHTHAFRLALEIFLVLAFILILTAGGFFAQARSSMSSADPTPPGNVPSAIQATPGATIQAALLAAEMAALTPPLYTVNLPDIQR
jgi:hypothetical protein